MKLKLFSHFMIIFLFINLSSSAVDLLKKEPHFDQDNKLFQQKREIFINQLNNGVDVGINFTLTRPRCIVLRSENINANPYHHSLVSIPGAEIRSGFGLPKILPGTGIECRESNIECEKKISQIFSVTLTDSYSISTSSGQTYSESISNSIGKGFINSNTISIGKAIENSFSKSFTHTDEKSLSDQISNALQKTMEKSTGITFGNNMEISQTGSEQIEETTTKTNNTETDETITDSIEKGITKSIGGGRETTSETSQENCDTHTAGVSAEAFGIGASYSYSNQNCLSNRLSNSEQSNWNNQLSDLTSNSMSKRNSKGNSISNAVSIGRTNSNTKSFGSSSSKENRASDSISVSSEIGRTQARLSSDSNSSTISNSDSLRFDDSFSSSTENTISNNHGKEVQNITNTNNETGRSTAYTRTIEYSYTFKIKPGKCQLSICKPMVKSVAIPFECINEKDESLIEINHVEYMTIDEKHGCVTSQISCDEKKFFFEIINKEFNNAKSGQNALVYNKTLKVM